MTNHRAMPYLRHSLVAAVLGADYATPKRPAKPRKIHSRPPSVHGDELLLEVRRLREHVGMKPKSILAHMQSLGHELTANQISNWLEYRTRAHLVPDMRDEPYSQPKPVENTQE
jgi:hypothetical protein